jgi:hypothetical protein
MLLSVKLKIKLGPRSASGLATNMERKATAAHRASHAHQDHTISYPGVHLHLPQPPGLGVQGVPENHDRFPVDWHRRSAARQVSCSLAPSPSAGPAWRFRGAGLTTTRDGTAAAVALTGTYRPRPALGSHQSSCRCSVQGNFQHVNSLHGW